MSEREKYLEAARRELEKYALAYARMNAFGYYVDVDNRHCYVCASDKKMHLDHFTQFMQNAANRLLVELQSIELPERTP